MRSRTNIIVDCCGTTKQPIGLLSVCGLEDARLSIIDDERVNNTNWYTIAREIMAMDIVIIVSIVM